MDDPNIGDRATPRSANGGSRPVPDPTELTDRAIARLEKSLTAYIDGEIKNLGTKIDGAILRTNERFEQSERVRVEQKNDTKAAVDAALSAAKEAVKEQTTASERSIDKSEATTREALKQLGETFAKTTDGLSDKIEDLKERVGRGESIKVGATENRTATYALVGSVISIVLFVIAIIGFVVSNSSGV